MLTKEDIDKDRADFAEEFNTEREPEQKPAPEPLATVHEVPESISREDDMAQFIAAHQEDPEAVFTEQPKGTQ